MVFERLKRKPGYIAVIRAFKAGKNASFVSFQLNKQLNKKPPPGLFLLNDQLVLVSMG